MRRGLRLTSLALLIAAPVATMTPVVDRAEAQSGAPVTERRGFFDMLFGRRPAPAPAAKRQTPPAARSSNGAPVAKVIPKEETARRILVVGDFVGGAVARGLEQTFAEEPRVAVVNLSNGNSGIVRDDYYDWGARLPDILNEQKPDVVVIAIGSNDRQQIKTGGSRYAPLSENWARVYGERIAGLADTMKVSGRPFFWVGTAPMRSSSASRDMAYFNGLYKPRVAEAGGHFVDIWNGFANEDGRFVSSGPDVDGNLRALRTKDGINFTRAGRLKLAFYVEREMKRQIGFGTGAADVMLLSSPTSKIEIGPDGEMRLVGPIISLSGPRPGARDVLTGEIKSAVVEEATTTLIVEPEQAEPDTETPHYLLVIKGGSLPNVPGRADDFTWPPLRPTDEAEVAPAAFPGTATQ